MLDNISPILQWLNLHPHLAGLVTFLISASESIAIIGTIIPGVVTMTAIGTLVGAGVIPLWPTFIWATLGAVLGDNISYGIGFYFKNGLRRMWPFRNYPQWLTMGEDFFHRHGMKSVFIGRFIGPTRAIVPVVAGMLHMKPLRFITISLIASAAWAPLYMLPGILLGEATMELPPDVAAQMVLRLVLLGLFFIIAAWIVYRIFLLIKKQVDQLLNAIWQRLSRSRYFHIVTTILKHHDAKKSHGQLVLAFYFTLCAIAFTYLAMYVFSHSSPTILIDKIVLFLFRSIHTPKLDNSMLWLTLLGEHKVLIPTTLVIAAWLIWKDHWRSALHALGLLALTVGSLEFFKHLIHSPRPWGIVSSPHSFSFPSGHTTFALTFYIGLGLLLIPSNTFRFKKPLFVLLGLLVFATSLSRLYLGAHWFTDVLGGWLLGACLLMLIVISYNRQQEKPIQTGSLLLVASVTIMVCSLALYGLEHKKLQTNYAMVEWPQESVSFSTWWLHPDDKSLPLYRIGRFGLPIEVLNLQWLGNLEDIKKVLLSQGWEQPEEQRWIDVLPRITDIGSAEHLPIVSPLHLDKKPALVLVKKQTGEKRPIVLRLWNSDILIKSSNQQLWVGTVGPVQRTYSWLIHYKRNYNVVINSALIFNTPPKNYVVKELSVTTNIRHKNRSQTIILIKSK